MSTPQPDLHENDAKYHYFWKDFIVGWWNEAEVVLCLFSHSCSDILIATLDARLSSQSLDNQSPKSGKWFFWVKSWSLCVGLSLLGHCMILWVGRQRPALWILCNLFEFLFGWALTEELPFRFLTCFQCLDVPAQASFLSTTLTTHTFTHTSLWPLFGSYFIQT